MIERIDHVNLVVTDLDGMCAFYERVLGLRQSKRVTIEGAWIDAVVGLPGVRADVVYLDATDGPRVELIRYQRPAGARPGGLDVANTRGLRHLAFRVTDIERAAVDLRAAGVEPLSPVALVPDAQVTYAGGVRKRLVYFRDPEGNLLELCEYR